MSERQDFRRRFMLLLVIGISVLFLFMIRGFLMALLLAAIFAGLGNGITTRLAAWLGGRRYAASGIVLLLMLLLIIGPVAGFVSVLVSEAVAVSRSVRPWIERQLDNPTQFDTLMERIPFVTEWLPDRDTVLEKVGEFASTTASLVVNGAAAGTRGAARFFLQFFVMLYAMFFFLADGKQLLYRALEHLPLAASDSQRLLDRFTEVTRATLKGTVAIGIVQGTLAGAAFAVAGIEGSVFWGTIMAVLSVIPGVGVVLVWVPAAVYLGLAGKLLASILLALWCAGVVGTVDNLLRPRLVGKDAKMPDLLILVSTLGGLAFFGAAGILIGPIVAALFSTIWDIFGETFSDILNDEEALLPEQDSE